MPALSDLTGSGSGTDPILTQVVASNPQVEPLGGPVTVDDLMDRFPEEVYNQSHDTHLYRFLTALCGDSGAGLLKKQTYVARLLWEAEFLNFQDLDNFYTSHFRFNRLKSETYTLNPDDALTPSQWDAILLADQQYKQRIQDFFNATRLGNSPDGLALAARSGSGIDTDIVEHYRYIYDQYSDLPLGLTPLGRTAMTNEYVVVPRMLSGGVGVTSSYVRNFIRQATFTPPTLNTTARPVKTTSKLSVSLSTVQTPSYQLLPEIERNVVEILDRLGPVTTIATIQPDEQRFVAISVTPTVAASSSRIHVNRFVTGNGNVSWPDMDTAKNYFIAAGLENEAGYYFGNAREYPVVFHTVEGIRAYTNDALNDPTYDTASFFDASSGLATFESYKSEQIGTFNRLLQSIYTFLQQQPTDSTYTAANALAVHDTPLIIEGSGVTG